MARVLRIQFPGAIYHVMARGNARQSIFRDERDYGRFLEGLEATVDKFRFEVFSFVCLPNHIQTAGRPRREFVLLSAAGGDGDTSPSNRRKDDLPSPSPVSPASETQLDDDWGEL